MKPGFLPIFVAKFCLFLLPNFGEIWLKTGEIWSLNHQANKIPGFISYAYPGSIMVVCLRP